MTEHTPVVPPRGRRITVALVVVLLAAVAVVAAVITLRPGGPGEGSAEVGFSQDMSTHHAQAVKMAFIVRDQTADPEVRLLAYDIINTQSAQIGMMTAWLDRWKQPKIEPGGAMRWMNGHGGAHVTAGGKMPGMATEAQLKALQSAKGKDAEVRFLQLMIAHHKGGISMAQAALSRAKDDQVQRLARTMVVGQQSEIDLMTRMLRDRGAVLTPAG